jgi:hypothetical protein
MCLRELVTEALINPIIRTITRYFRHAYPHTRDNICDLNKCDGFQEVPVATEIHRYVTQATFMEKKLTREACNGSAAQQFFDLLLYLKVHYLVQTNSVLDVIALHNIRILIIC